MTQHSGTSRRAAWARVSQEELRPAASMPSIVAFFARMDDAVTADLELARGAATIVGT
jgi:hypothetical protein